MYYGTDPAKTTEAHMLNIRAIMLEPDNINYRLNAAAILMNSQRYSEALAVLKAASTSPRRRNRWSPSKPASDRSNNIRLP
jgi:thioredoxin-like negative regulator of GroEL